MFSEDQKSHFAGYTDAEGCVSINRNSNSNAGWYAFVGFKQTQPAVLDLLQPYYGGSFSFEKQKRGRPLKRWRLQALEEVRRFLVDVFPHLREKRTQAGIILNEFDPRAPYGVGLILHERMQRLQAKQLEPVIIKSRLAVAEADPNKRCLECGEPGFARGFCAAHYQKAKREGRIKTNPKGEGVPFKYGRPLKEHEAAYFAGYFDGDGSLVLRCDNERHWRPAVTFGQTQPDAVLDMQLVYGGSLKFLKTKYRPKPYLQYQLCQRAAVIAFLRDIQPHVIEKKDQVDTLLSSFQVHCSFEEGLALRDQLSVMKKRTLLVD